ncbi:MAG: uracil-DNA glycosylase [Phycisphaerales bacterium]
MTPSTDDTRRRAARQMIEIDRLFGVGFVPAPPDQARATTGSVAPESLVTADNGRADALDALRLRHDSECAHCVNATYHTQTVFGEGDPNADLMFIGEAPGAEEDRTGRPFVGRAGQLLERMINAMGLSREEVYIANILKSRPPNNATPTPAEVDKCSPFLVEQIRIIQPKAIVALGSPSAKFLLSTTTGISKLRGQWHSLAIAPDLEVEVMPTFHPAYLLRQYTPDNRQKVWSDLQKVMDRLGLEAPASRGS